MAGIGGLSFIPAECTNVVLPVENNSFQNNSIHPLMHVACLKMIPVIPLTVEIDTNRITPDSGLGSTGSNVSSVQWSPVAELDPPAKPFASKDFNSSGKFLAVMPILCQPSPCNLNISSTFTSPTVSKGQYKETVESAQTAQTPANKIPVLESPSGSKTSAEESKRSPQTFSPFMEERRTGYKPLTEYQITQNLLSEFVSLQEDLSEESQKKVETIGYFLHNVLTKKAPDNTTIKFDAVPKSSSFCKNYKDTENAAGNDKFMQISAESKEKLQAKESIDNGLYTNAILDQIPPKSSVHGRIELENAFDNLSFLPASTESKKLPEECTTTDDGIYSIFPNCIQELVEKQVIEQFDYYMDPKKNRGKEKRLFERKVL